jgi:hypothetical protein
VEVRKQELLHSDGRKLNNNHWALQDLDIQQGSLLLLRIKERFTDLNGEQIERLKGFTLLLIQGIEVIRKRDGKNVGTEVLHLTPDLKKVICTMAKVCAFHNYRCFVSNRAC